MTNLDLGVNRTLFLIQLIVVVGVHLKVVERKLLLDALLELLSLFKSQRVGLGNDGYNVDNIRELLENDNIDGLQRVTGRLDKEQAAVDTRVLDVTLSLRCELLTQVG